MAVEKIDDDPVTRIVDRAVQAQTRLLVVYMNGMREQIRQEVKREVQAEFGGDRTYICKGSADRNRQRDEAIRRDARPVAEGGMGLSLRALGSKYHMSKSRIAEVLAAGDINSAAQKG